MNMKEINTLINTQVDTMIAKAGMMTLGKLRDVLWDLPVVAEVQFEDGTYPGVYDSYRGYYHLIAIRPKTESCNVARFLDITQAAIGGWFTGYKGGDFIMDETTPIWVARWGEASGVGLVGTEMVDGVVTLKTKAILA